MHFTNSKVLKFVIGRYIFKKLHLRFIETLCNIFYKLYNFYFNYCKYINFVNHPEMIRLKISLNKIIIKITVYLEKCNKLV